MVSLLRRNRDFSIFLVTQGISNLGDSVSAVAVPLLVLQLTRSPAMAAAVALLETVPRLVLQLPAGALVDRWDRRRALLAADVGRGVVTLLVPAAALLHGPVLLVLFAVAVPLSALSSLFGAGFGAITPSLVGREHVQQAYALVEGGESLAWVAGPAVAGVLVGTVGGANALAIDGASFLVSAFGLALIRTPHGERVRVPASLVHDMREGLRFLVQTADLRRTQLSWSLYGAIGYGVVIGLVFVGSRGGSAGPALASLAVAAYAAGSLLGTALAGWRRPASPSRAVAAGLAVLAAGALLVATGEVFAVPAGGLLFGFGEGYFLVVFLALRAEATPDDLMGRVSSAGSLLSQVAAGIAVAWMGLALQWLGGSGTFALVTAFAAALAVWMAVARPLPAAPR
ncbi:MAG TPA: MFS transporter [Terriglobales bacterium]|nr:MFS transporter [Terriglobales bacterium]